MLLVLYKCDKVNDDFHFRMEDNLKAFGSYSKGLVYIGDSDYLDDVKDEARDEDVLVLDERDKLDPNMKILSSFKVKREKERQEVLHVLELYEESDPSEWSRSFSSMDLEWHIHNLFYYIGYKLDSTTDVDLNNDDESAYKNDLKRLIIRR